MKHIESVNAQGRPTARGQVIKFTSPQGAAMIDCAEHDRYGNLVWVAMREDDPRYSLAMAGTLGGSQYPL